MTHLSHTTRWRRGRACTPAALTMIPLPRSLTPSPSSGSHQDSNDLMMRETTLIIHTRQTSPLAVLLSHTGTHAFEHTQACTNNNRCTHTHAHSKLHKQRHIQRFWSRMSVQYASEDTAQPRPKKNSDACAQTDADQNRSTNTHKHVLETHKMPPHTYSIPLGQTVFGDNFVIICFGFTQEPVW